MGAVTTYEQAYIDDCRDGINQQVSIFRDVVRSANDAAAAKTFEPIFFGDLVVVLDTYFLHRSRMQKGKDDNVLNEVRVVASSIMQNHSVMFMDQAVPFDPKRSILGLSDGDTISIKAPDFSMLASAFFEQIEQRYTQPPARSEA